MKGDFTRDTFHAGKHFSRVLMQQGRVQLDADWNEQNAILLHYLRTLAKDIFGPYAGPADELGFEIISKDRRGRVDNFIKKKIEPDRVRRNALIEAVSKGDVVIAPGRYYVKGILVENDKCTLYSEQLGFDSAQLGGSRPDNLPSPEDIQNFQKSLLYYLDVWERHITYVEDDNIREVALGGPDTCTRAEVVWQVKVLFQEDQAVLDCNAVDTLVSTGTGRLRARARLDKPPTELCVIPPESRYRGAENQLYRVEVHTAGRATKDDNGATFKWSRENGSVTFPIRSLSGTTVTLEQLGRELHVSLKPGDWVELVDDAIAMCERAGPLAQVDVVNRDEQIVMLKLPSGTILPSYTEATADASHALLRRWDHVGDLKGFGGALQITEQDGTESGLKTGWIKLEDGVEIWFAKDGQYRTGDYWLIPARTVAGDVEWPDEVEINGKPRLDSDGNPVAAAVVAHGPRHYYAPLFLSTIKLGSGERVGHDCRCAIQPMPCTDYGYAFGERGIGPNF